MEYISVLTTIALAIITYFYLVETKKIRKEYEKSFYYETSPKAFLEDVITTFKLNETKRTLDFFTTLYFRNTGKTEAFNFQHEYLFTSGNKSMKGEFGPMPYLHPGRGIKTATKLLGLDVKDENLFNLLKKDLKEKKPISINKPNFPPIILEVNVKYLDQNKKTIEYHYNFEYQLETNIWIYKC